MKSVLDNKVSDTWKKLGDKKSWEIDMVDGSEMSIMSKTGLVSTELR